MTNDLRSFLNQIKKTNDLKTIKKRVSTKFEIATITEQFENSNALLFQNIIGRKFSVVSNLVGTRARFAKAIGAKPTTIHQTMVKAINASKKPKTLQNAKFFENSSKKSKFSQFSAKRDETHSWIADFKDRGTLRPGAWADIIVYNQEELGFVYDRPVYADAFPGGERRLIQKPEGLYYTIVNGAVTFERNECTGALPGKLLRSYDMVT